MDSFQKSEICVKIFNCGLITIVIGSAIGIVVLFERWEDFLLLGPTLVLVGFVAFLISSRLYEKYAPRDLTELIRTLHKSTPMADIPWGDCENESFEIVKGLLLKGHSGMDIMFMGTRLEYYGLIATHHEREEGMLKWACEGGPQALAETNEVLKKYGYALVKMDGE